MGTKYEISETQTHFMLRTKQSRNEKSHYVPILRGTTVSIAIPPVIIVSVCIRVASSNEGKDLRVMPVVLHENLLQRPDGPSAIYQYSYLLSQTDARTRGYERTCRDEERERAAIFNQTHLEVNICTFRVQRIRSRETSTHARGAHALRNQHQRAWFCSPYTAGSQGFFPPQYQDEIQANASAQRYAGSGKYWTAVITGVQNPVTSW